MRTASTEGIDIYNLGEDEQISEGVIFHLLLQAFLHFLPISCHPVDDNAAEPASITI